MKKDVIEKVKKLPISEVAIKLGLKIQNKKCLCFIHNEKTPSLSINHSKNMWFCFGCLNGGGVIELVQKYYDYSFVDACKWLASSFNIYHYNIIQNSIKKNVNITLNNAEPDYEVYNWFFENLEVTESVKSFLVARKYPFSLLEKYNLKGLDDCKSFFKKLKDRWGVERLLKCGLAKEVVNKATGEIFYNFIWWTNTLFIPFYDFEGKIAYIQGRSLSEKFEKRYKYINLKGIETIPFNLPVLKNLKENDVIVITEGVTDCLSCSMMGKNALGMIGANGFKKQYVYLLQNFQIHIIPDNDVSKTGEKFANKIRNCFYEIGKTVKVHPLTEFKDISEYYINKWHHGENY